MDGADWRDRNVGFFQVNLDETPELAMCDPNVPNQFIVGPGLRRELNFQTLESQTNEQRIDALTFLIRELTGDWINDLLKCEDIKAPGDNFFYDNVVFLGNTGTMHEGGEAEYLSVASMYDKYTFDEQRVGYWFHKDETGACKQEFGYDLDKDYILISHGANPPSRIIELAGSQEYDLSSYLFTLHTDIVKATPRWG